MIIAIDGPAGAGKGTLAKKLADKLNLAYLDTGLLYRAVGYALLQDNQSLDDEKVAHQYAVALTPQALTNPNLRSDTAAKAASKISTYANVRAALLDFQRTFAHHPPLPHQGAILDGRDIGTTVLPEANIKFFVEASPEVRAQRRYLELQARGDTTSLDQVLADIKARDTQDRTRQNSPLKPAEDAILIDTSNLTAEEAFERALSVVLHDNTFP